MGEKSLVQLGEMFERVFAELRAGSKSDLPANLTLKEAARQLSVSQKTLGRLIHSGTVLTVQVGPRRFVPASEIRKLSTPKRQPKQSAPPKAKKRAAEAKAGAASLRAKLRR